jgi:hypothetical protein
MEGKMPARDRTRRPGKLCVACALVFLFFSACEDASSPSSVGATKTTLPAPPPTDGIVVLDGTIGGTFTFDIGPVRVRRSIAGCGDAKISVPYRETAGGKAATAEYALQILDIQGSRRSTTRKMQPLPVVPNSRGVFFFYEDDICVEYTDADPLRAQVALNFGGVPGGTVSQVAGVGPLTATSPPPGNRAGP